MTVLFFADSATSMVAIPSDKVRFITATSATNIAIHYEGDDDGVGSVDITVTSGKADEVCKEIGRVLVSSPASVVTIADDVNSIYASSDITAVATLDVSA